MNTFFRQPGLCVGVSLGRSVANWTGTILIEQSKDRGRDISITVYSRNTPLGLIPCAQRKSN